MLRESEFESELQDVHMRLSAGTADSSLLVGTITRYHEAQQLAEAAQR